MEKRRVFNLDLKTFTHVGSLMLLHHVCFELWALLPDLSRHTVSLSPPEPTVPVDQKQKRTGNQWEVFVQMLWALTCPFLSSHLSVPKHATWGQPLRRRPVDQRRRWRRRRKWHFIRGVVEQNQHHPAVPHHPAAAAALLPLGLLLCQVLLLGWGATSHRVLFEWSAWGLQGRCAPGMAAGFYCNVASWQSALCRLRWLAIAAVWLLNTGLLSAWFAGMRRKTSREGPELPYYR